MVVTLGNLTIIKHHLNDHVYPDASPRFIQNLFPAATVSFKVSPSSKLGPCEGTRLSRGIVVLFIFCVLLFRAKNGP